MNTQRNQRDLLVVIMAFVSFIGLGLTGGLLGLAWTPMQAEFVLPIDAVGILLFSGTIGYLASSFYSGQIAFRLGAGRMFIAGTGLMVAGLLGYVIAPSWGILIFVAFVTGLGTGTVDAGMNNYVAAHFGERIMNWLHACYGIGITIGPLIMTVVINNAASWRWGYAVVCGAQILLLVAFVMTLKRWRGTVRQTTAAPTPERRVGVIDTLKLPMAWLSIALCFIYAGLESAPGQWVYPLFTESRQIAPEAAGLWVSVYWGSFTVGRIFFGAIITRVKTLSLMRFCMIFTVLGVVLLWWNPSAAVGFAGLTLFGFAQAPIFPVLVSTAVNRVGIRHAPNTIGFQMAGASLGIAAVPGLAGVLGKNFGLEIIVPFLVLACIIMIVLHEMTVVWSRPPAPAGQPASAD